jgi:hypothetical protein
MVHAQSSTPAEIRGGDVDPLMIPLYRRASPEQKLAVVARLNSALLALKEGQLREGHPDWTAVQHRQALRQWWLGGDER